MEFILIAFLLLGFVSVQLFAFIWHQENIKANIVEKSIISSTTNKKIQYKKLMEIVDTVLNRNIRLTLYLGYVLPKRVFPKNFEQQIVDIVKTTDNDLSPFIKQELTQYVDDGYLIRYMTQATEIALLQHILDNEGKLGMD